MMGPFNFWIINQQMQFLFAENATGRPHTHPGDYFELGCVCLQPLGSVHAVRRAAPNFARPLPPPRACFKLASTLHDMKLIIARQPTAAQARSQPASPTAHAAAGSHAGAHAAAGPAIRRRKRLPAHARTPRKPPARTSGGNNASGGAVPGKCSRWGERHAPLRRFTTARPPGPDGPAVLACTPRIAGGLPRLA